MKNSSVKNRFWLQLPSILILFSFVFSFLPTALRAQTEPAKSRQLVADDKPVGNDNRLALVIGNADYQHTGKLKNAANDAVDVAAALRELGFGVIEGVNQNKQGMENKIREFGDRLNKQGGVGVFFYAGHGVQYSGKNYLVPIDADIPAEDEVDYRAVDVSFLLRKLVSAKNDLNIIILDACRNNPFAKEWSSDRAMGEDEGLAKIAAPKGTVLLYATEPGKVASDGTGRNGLFTQVFLEQIKKPNVEFDALYKTVASKVAEKSKNSQIPYKEGTNFRDFYFAGTPESPAPGRQGPVVASDEPEVTVKDAREREQEAWNLVKNSSDAEGFRIYLEDFPNGANSAKAKIRLEKLVWSEIEKSADKAKIQNYLKEFPGGENTTTARIKLRQLEARNTAEPTTVEPIEEESAPPTVKVPAPKPPKSRVTTPIKPIKSKKQPPSLGSKYEMRKNAVGMEFVNIPAGSFSMGSSEANVTASLSLARKEYSEVVREDFDNEKPQRRLTFGDDFWIGKTEVTQAQWTAVMGENPSNFKGCDDCPVERVSWEDAKKFVEKLNAADDGFVYRLPSEAEWEYAARGGANGLFGGAAIDEMAWHKGNSEDRTHPVATKEPNAFGLYDMHGNVGEWCEDIYQPFYDETVLDGAPNTSGGDAKYRVHRGGSWSNFPPYMRLMHRNKDNGTIRNIVVGFRVAARVK